MEARLSQDAVPSQLPIDLTEDEVRALAKGLGLDIPDDVLPEVTFRFTALMQELGKLDRDSLSSIDPRPLFDV